MPVDRGLARILGDWFECEDVAESDRQQEAPRAKRRRTDARIRGRKHSAAFDWRAGYEPEYRAATHPVVYFRRWG